MPTPLLNVRYRVRSGKHLLAAGFSGFDPLTEDIGPFYGRINLPRWRTQTILWRVITISGTNCLLPSVLQALDNPVTVLDEVDRCIDSGLPAVLAGSGAELRQ